MARLSLEPHLHPDLRLIASQVGLSRSRLFQQFKNSVGIAPTMYVDGLLLEQAIEMLIHSERPLEEISTNLGFAAQSSFSRFFKDRVGFPPNALRQAAHLN
jgi:AraC-like DNA-binding protein